MHHPSARSARIRTTVYVYHLARAARYHLDPMKLKFPSKRPRSYARASDVSEIPKADISLSLSLCTSISNPPLLSIRLPSLVVSLGLEKGREWLA